MFKLFLTAFLILSSPSVFAAPLGTIPTVEERNTRFIFDFRSDFWSSPYTYKSSPVRILNGEFRWPLFQNDTWAVSLALEDESLNLGRADFSLGKEKVYIANALGAQQIGFGARKDLSNGSTLSIFGAYATASDNPYADPRDSWFQGSVIYYGQQTEKHRWLLGIDQSNNRGIFNGTPFPYVGVMYTPDPNFIAVFGFPFLRLQWGTPDDLQTTFRLTPFSARLEVERKLEQSFVFRGWTGMTVRSYLHEQRIDDHDRLFYQEICIDGALIKNVSRSTGVVFGAGYSFDRRLYESEYIYSPNSKTTIIDNDFYARLGMEFRL